MNRSHVLTQAGRSAAKAVRRYQQRLPGLPLDSGPGTGTVYYLTPDFDEPSGGVRVMYRHVDALNAAGMPAAVLHSTRRFQCTWFEHNTRVTDTTVTRPGLRDLLVLPEIYAGFSPNFPRNALMSSSTRGRILPSRATLRPPRWIITDAPPISWR